MAFNDTLFQLGMDLTRSSTAQKEESVNSKAIAMATENAIATAPENAIAMASLNAIDVARINEVAHAACDETTPEIGQLAQDERKDFFIERNGTRFAGTHLIIDLFGARRLDDLKHVEKTLRACVEKAGATLLHIHLHHFTPNGGVSGVAVLAESHNSIHSWPEADYAALDVFMCGDAKPHLAVDVLREAFDVTDVVVKEHLRGQELEQLSWNQAASKDAPKRVAKGSQEQKKAA